MARILLNHGAHPCVINRLSQKDMIVDALGPVLCGVGAVRSLQCLAASKVAEDKIKYGDQDLTRPMQSFAKLH